MKTIKLIWLQLIAFIAILNLNYMYFSSGTIVATLSVEYLKYILLPLFSAIILFIAIMFSSLSYFIIRAKTRKNLLRISIIFLSIIMIASIISRILELINGNFCPICWFQTILYIIIFVLSISISSDLYKLLHKLFEKRNLKLSFEK